MLGEDNLKVLLMMFHCFTTIIDKKPLLFKSFQLFSHLVKQDAIHLIKLELKALKL